MKNDYIEEWRPVKGFEGYYEVSNLGKIYAIPRQYNGGFGAICNTGGDYMKVEENPYRGNRRTVVLCANGYKTAKYVSRIVAEAFIPNPYTKSDVDHILPIIDGGGDEAFNLRWVDRKGNMNNKMTKQRVDENRYKVKVSQYTKQGLLVKTFDSELQAEKETGIKRQNIDNCCKNKPRYKTAGGFIWKFS